jgi:hypothetical protein
VCFAAPQARWPERLGYEPLPLATLVADTRGLASLAVAGTSPSAIRPYEATDFDAVRNLYNTATCVQRLAVLRDDLAWERELLRARLAREGSPHALPLDFLVGEREGRVVSYLRAERPTASALTVLEYGFEVGQRDDVAALVRGVLAPLGDDVPRRLRSIAPTRLANLLPARRLAWRCQAGPRMLMRSFGSFDVPTDSPPDERLVWQADWLTPAGAVSRLAA